MESLGARLSDIPPHRATTVTSVAWDALGEKESRRLREFGLDEGIGVELLHHAFLGGTLSCRIGRMTIAMRRHVAAAIMVEPLPANAR